MEIYWQNIVIFVLSSLITFSSGDDVVKHESSLRFRNQERLPDPVRNFFAELGDLFLTVDQTISMQSAPKTNFADALKEQIYLRLRRPDHNYFERIQENYKELQKRVLTTITQKPEDKSSPENLGTDVQSENGKKYVGLPLLPLRTRINSKQLPFGSETLDKTSDINDPVKNIHPIEKSSKQDFDAVVNVAGSTVSAINKDSNVKLSVSQMPPLEVTWKEFQKRMEYIPVNQRSKIIPTEDEIKIAVNRFFKDVPQSLEILNALRGRGVNALSVSRTGELMKETKTNQDEIQDDIQSESAFDKYVEQLLENQAKLFLDLPLQSKTLREETATPQENIATATDYISNEKDAFPEETTDYSVWSTLADYESEVSTEIPTSTGIFLQNAETDSMGHFTTSDEMNFLPETYDETDDENQSIVKYVLEPESSTKTESSIQQEPATEIYRDSELKSSLLLAFTPAGVPLKLRISAETDNPIEFLHKSLTNAGVSLNIPVASYDSIEPVGNEVLQLGAGDGQTMTRALYIDITNEDELQALVETLRLSKRLNE